MKLGQCGIPVDPQHPDRVVAQGAGAAQMGKINQGATLDADAERYRQTGVLPPNARTVQGQQEAKAVRARAVEQELNAGGNPADYYDQMAGLPHAAGIGKSAGERTRATPRSKLRYYS